MITYVISDLFYSPAQVLVNPVNTVGVMSQGVAHDFKRFYPDMFDRYRELCQADMLDIGGLMLHRTVHKWVLNFPTRKHYRATSRLEYIEAGLKKFVESYGDRGITSASFPRLGTSSGDLDWESEVRPLMEAYLDPLPVAVFIHQYDEDNPFVDERRNVRAMRSWLEGQPKAIAYETFWKDLQKLLDDKEDFKTLDDAKTAFRASLDNRKRGLRLFVDDDMHYIAASSLGDLWQYVRQAGYVHPANLPAGLDEYAPFIVAMLANLHYTQPIHIATVGDAYRVGLHYMPPVDKDADKVATHASLNTA